MSIPSTSAGPSSTCSSVPTWSTCTRVPRGTSAWWLPWPQCQPRPGASYALYLVYDLSDVQQSLDSVLGVLLLFGSGFLVVNALVAWWASRSVVRPVQQAATAAESLSGGNLAVRMPVPASSRSVGGSPWVVETAGQEVLPP